MNFELLVIILFSYLIGSIPFGYILIKIFLKKDIRKEGSGNIGATNVIRAGNKIFGFITLILDITKAVLPLLIIKFSYEDYIYISSLCIFIGHVFPVWLKFKGGKGIASYLGILFCLNIWLGIIFVVSWIVIFVLSKYSSLSSLLASFLIPVFQYIVADQNNFYFYIIMFVLILFTHRENIKRLKNNTESRSKIY